MFTRTRYPVAMYAIDTDVERRMFWVTARGFWSVTTITTFSTEMLARYTAARVRHGPFAVLTDVRDMPIQTSETIDKVGMLVSQGLKLTAAPLVLVVGSTLAKMQAERVMGAPNCRVFTDMDAAQTWLEEQWPSARGGKCPAIGPGRAAA